MIVNKYKILLPTINDKDIDIPIEINWDLLDRSDSLIEYEKQTVKEVLNQDKDFEVVRFEHARNPNSLTPNLTDINYEFYFLPSGATSASTSVDWITSYTWQGFTPKEIYYYGNSFKKSFFKLDLYDTTNLKDQTNYVTIILPTQQGLTTPQIIGWNTRDIKKPVFKLDFLGDKEGFFVYWLKNRDFININTFYMTAKFFDAKTGVFVKMMNRPQSNLTGINKFNFNQERYFYYKVILDYTNYTYKVYDINTGTDVLVGDSTNPIKWYEYLNP
jgi:hypothetical protein